ncbi:MULTISPECIES: hypothetical protein [Burkholderia cepacia complex]|uniref:hypothetical protein n=1 Tax=Burkholderia cepacia complex TaxID=87882 RepID=UPI00157AEDE8|nr:MULTISPECIES: hypothetical protein [Burkholderia cepacia complex]
MDDMNCMIREAHVQFRENLAVRLRWALRQNRQSLHDKGDCQHGTSPNLPVWVIVGI